MVLNHYHTVLMMLSLKPLHAMKLFRGNAPQARAPCHFKFVIEDAKHARKARNRGVCRVWYGLV